MKKIITLLPALLALCLLTSCGAARYMSALDSAAVSDMVLIRPYSIISYYDGNKSGNAVDDSLSVCSEELISSLLLNSAVPVERMIDLDYSDAATDVAYGIADALGYMSTASRKSIGECPIPHQVDALLESQGIRYGMLVFATGFDKTRKAYTKEVATDVLVATASIALSALLGGGVGVYGVTQKSNSDIMIAVADSETDRFVFYDRSLGQDRSPLDNVSVWKQLDSMLGGYFYEKY